MSEKSIIIIGAGISGLCAGSYLQMNGYKTQIFEMHSIPGGMCTAWKRKGYTFEGCIDWLVGSSPTNAFHGLWKELNALQGKQIIEFDEHFRVEYEKGKVFTIYTDADKLQDELIKIGPEDEKEIRSFIKDIKTASKVDMPIEKAQELFNVIDYTKYIFKSFPFLMLAGKYGKITIDEYARRFKNPTLRDKFPMLVGMDGKYSTMALIMMLGWMHIKSAGYPVGGSLGLIRSIQNTYKKFGGKIYYNSKVEKILVEENKACGIKLENGKTYKADIVISAADGHYTIFNMLDGKYVDDSIKSLYETMDLFTPIIQISIGVNKTFEDAPHAQSFLLDNPIQTGGNTAANGILVKIFNYDTTMSPKDKTCITVLMNSEYEYWENLRISDKEKYNTEKDRIAKEVISALDSCLGGIEPLVEVYDVATPATYVRYTNVWKGSYEGWAPVPKAYTLNIKKTLPGLENFYMVGQWIQPGGGLPTGIMTGRAITQILCKKDKKEFVVKAV